MLLWLMTQLVPALALLQGMASAKSVCAEIGWRDDAVRFGTTTDVRQRLKDVFTAVERRATTGNVKNRIVTQGCVDDRDSGLSRQEAAVAARDEGDGRGHHRAAVPAANTAAIAEAATLRWLSCDATPAAAVVAAAATAAPALQRSRHDVVPTGRPAISGVTGAAAAPPTSRQTVTDWQLPLRSTRLKRQSIIQTAAVASSRAGYSEFTAPLRAQPQTGRVSLLAQPMMIDVRREQQPSPKKARTATPANQGESDAMLVKL